MPTLMACRETLQNPTLSTSFVRFLGVDILVARYENNTNCTKARGIWLWARQATDFGQGPSFFFFSSLFCFHEGGNTETLMSEGVRHNQHGWTRLEGREAACCLL